MGRLDRVDATGRLPALVSAAASRLASATSSPDECVVQAIRVELSERGRERGDCVPVAACSIATVEGTAAPICNLARKLLALGVDPSAHLSIWRGEMQCFVDAPVSRWVKLTVKEGQSSPVFAPYVPFSGIPVASQRAKSGVRHG